MLITDGGSGQTVEDVLRALGAALDERHATGVALIEVPEGLMVRARVTPAPGDPADGPRVSMERAFGHKEFLEQRMAALQLRGSTHRAGPVERALRVMGRYIDAHDLQQVTLMEHDARQGWMLWHRSRTAARHLLVTFDHAEIERAAAVAQQSREGMPVAAEA